MANHTCKRPGCDTSVLAFLDPEYCSHDCRNIERVRHASAGTLIPATQLAQPQPKPTTVDPAPQPATPTPHNATQPPNPEHPGWLHRAIHRITHPHPHT